MPVSSKPILLVEDYEPDAAIFIRAMRLANLTNPVTVLPTGDEALAYFESLKTHADSAQALIPSVVMLDLKLPGKDGLEILEWLRAQPEFNELLIVVVTATTDPETLQRVYKLGADSFLRKPVMPDEIKNLVAAFKTPWFAS
jgi:two-component system, response regulator